MAAVSIRGLDDQVQERLRVRAARHGRSMQAEIWAILAEAVSHNGQAEALFTALLARFSDLGGVELDLPPRTVTTRAS